MASASRAHEDRAAEAHLEGLTIHHLSTSGFRLRARAGRPLGPCSATDECAPGTGLSYRTEAHLPGHGRTCRRRAGRIPCLEGGAGARRRHVPCTPAPYLRPGPPAAHRRSEGADACARPRGPLLARPDGRDSEVRRTAIRRLSTWPFAPAPPRSRDPARRGRADGRALTARRRRGRSMIDALRADTVDRTLAALHRACRRRAATPPTSTGTSSRDVGTHGGAAASAFRRPSVIRRPVAHFVRRRAR
jgi:hypothetical protein